MKLFIVALMVSLALHSNVSLEKAFAAHKRGDLQEAEKHYREAIAAGANETIANYNLANLYYQTKRMSLAIINYQKVIEKAPEFKNAYHNLGKIFFLNQEYVRALKIFLSYHEINPRDWDNLVLIGDTFKELNLSVEANEFYEKALELDKGREDSYLVLAEFYLSLLDEDRAFYYLDLALENNVNTLKINELKADLFNEEEEYFKAIYLYNEILANSALDLTRDEVYRLKTKIIDNFLAANVFQLAINELQSLVLDFNRRNDLLKLENLYQKQGKPDDAFSFFKTVYGENKNGVSPILKNLLITAYNSEKNNLVNEIVAFYEENELEDEVYRLIRSQRQ